MSSLTTPPPPLIPPLYNCGNRYVNRWLPVLKSRTSRWSSTIFSSFSWLFILPGALWPPLLYKSSRMQKYYHKIWLLLFIHALHFQNEVPRGCPDLTRTADRPELSPDDIRFLFPATLSSIIFTQNFIRSQVLSLDTTTDEHIFKLVQVRNISRCSWYCS